MKAVIARSIPAVCIIALAMFANETIANMTRQWHDQLIVTPTVIEEARLPYLDEWLFYYVLPAALTALPVAVVTGALNLPARSLCTFAAFAGLHFTLRYWIYSTDEPVFLLLCSLLVALTGWGVGALYISIEGCLRHKNIRL